MTKEKAEDKAAEAVKPQKPPRDERNGIVRPAADTQIGKVWQTADDLSREYGRPAKRAEVREAIGASVNPATVATQYARWVKYHGASSLIRQHREATTAGKKAERQRAGEEARAKREADKAEKQAADEAKRKADEARAAEKKAADEKKAAEKKAAEDAKSKAAEEKAEAKRKADEEKAAAKAKAQAEKEAAAKAKAQQKAAAKAEKSAGQKAAA